MLARLAAAHQVERPAGDRARRHVLAEGGRTILAVERDREQQPAVVGLEHAPEGHREPALDVAPPALGHQVAELGFQLGIEPRRIEQLDAVAGLATAAHRLAQALVLLAVEAEAGARRRPPRRRCTGRASRSRRRPGASRRTRPSPRPASRARRRTRGTPPTLRRAGRPGRPDRATRARCRCARGTRRACRGTRTTPCRRAARSTTTSRSRSARR